MPSRTTLLRAWGLMMGLTALSIWAAVSDEGPAPATAAMAAGLFKGLLILWVYLNLGRGNPGWKAVFIVFLATIAVLVLGIFLLGPLVAKP